MYLLILSLFVVLVFALYEYLVWHYQYWAKRGVPGPKPNVLTGSFPKSFMQKENMIYELDRIYKEYRGKTPYVGVFSTRLPQLLITDNELIKRILIRDFKNFHDNEFADATDKITDPIFSRNPFMLSGEEWKEKRAEITPAFTVAKLKAMYPIIEDVCQKMNLYIERQLDKSTSKLTVVDAKELAAKFTTDVVSSCIYGVDSKAFTDEKSMIRQMGTELFAPSTKLLIYFTLQMIFPFITKIYAMPFVSKRTETFFTQLMKDAVKMRQASGNLDRDDYLNYLLELKKKKNISDLDMAAHTITFFLDGFETSSIVIAHMLYVLGKHPHVQERLRAEIQETMTANKSESISFENIGDMVYLDQVFNETLRLYSPAGISTRKCTIATEFIDYKDKRVAIEKDVVAIIPTMSVHLDAEHYENPATFDPDRFSPATGGLKPYKDKGVFLAFSDGPRVCLGQRFGTTQSKAAVVQIVRNYAIRVNNKTQEPYVIDPKAFLTMPIGGLWIDLEKLPQS